MPDWIKYVLLNGEKTRDRKINFIVTDPNGLV